jgi:GTP cyclohydrolase II
VACACIPASLGEFELCLYSDHQEGKEHLALVKGDIAGQRDVLVRLHPECFTGDVLESLRCDCGDQLQRAMHLIAEEGAGVIVYLRQEGRGIGLLDKLRAYNLQDVGFDTVDANLMLGHQADERDYTVAALILKDLGVDSARLLTNNPLKIESLQGLGVPVTDHISLQATVTGENAGYLVDIVDIETHLDALVAYYRDRTLNELPEFEGLNPSIEHFARILCEALLNRIQAPNLNAIRIQMWENEIAWAAYRLEY